MRCDNTILRNESSSFITPFTVREDHSDMPEVLMHRDMASLNVLQLSATASFTSLLISDFQTWACIYFFLKDNWMGKKSYYQFRPTAKITLIRKCFSVTRFNKKK